MALKILKCALVGVIILAHVGCATYRPVHPVDGGYAPGVTMNAGDIIRVVLRNGTTKECRLLEQRVEQIDCQEDLFGPSFAGDETGAVLHINRDEIVDLRVRKLDKWATAGAAVAIFYIVLLIYTLTRGWDPIYGETH